ncbi:MAG: TatD family hydrolase [Chloroflexi bacterium]|nr:TatD family hydrolase [Chloroflexota bacterium]
MRIFDAHIHVDTRGIGDLKTLALFGTEAVVTCAHDYMDFSCAASVLDHWNRIMTLDRKRLAANNIQAFIALGLHPGGIPRTGEEEVLGKLREKLGIEGVVAIGEIGLHRYTEDELRVFRRQLDLGKELNKPCIVHTPERQKAEVTRRVLDVITDVGIDKDLVLIDHVNEDTFEMVRSFGGWIGLSVQTGKLSDERAASLIAAHGADRVILNSDLASLSDDVLALPKAVFQMKRMSLPRREIERAVFDNAVAFFGAENGTP